MDQYQRGNSSERDSGNTAPNFDVHDLINMGPIQCLRVATLTTARGAPSTQGSSGLDHKCSHLVWACSCRDDAIGKSGILKLKRVMESALNPSGSKVAHQLKEKSPNTPFLVG